MATKAPQIKYTTVGRMVVVTVDKKKFTLNEEDPKLKEKIKKQVDSFNKIPTEAKKTALIKLLTPKETKAKEEKLVLKKQIKQTKKRVEEGVEKQSLEALQKATEAIEKLTKDNEALVATNKELTETTKTLTDKIQKLEAPKELKPSGSSVGYRRPGEH